MDIPVGARRTEDIALDLLKFIASTANVVKGSSGGTPGFAAASTSKSDDQVAQLLDLYARCKTAVEGSSKK